MPNLVYSNADFVAYTKIRSTEVNAKFNDIKTLLNTTGLDTTNVQLNGLNRNRLALGTANHVVINGADGNMSSEAKLAKTRGGTGVDLTTEALEIPEIATPSTPASGFARIYAKSDGKLYIKDDGGTETQVGSGGQSAGISFIGLDSTWQPTATNDQNAESSVGNWAVYNDGSVSAPVDGTGGTANVTIARTTTVGEVIDGQGSFKFVKDSTNRQGQGTSCVGYIPPAYRLSRCMIEIPYKVTSGTLTDGDMNLYIYDVTNSELITPFQVSKMVGTQGIARAYFSIKTTTAQIRLILHVASTSASAWDLCFDDVKVTPNVVVSSAPVGDWQAYTPTFGAGFGTVAANEFYWRRVGDSLEIQGRLTTGTVAASAATVTLPTGLTVDSSKVPSVRVVGTFAVSNGTGTGYFGSGSVTATASGTTVGFAAYDSSGNGVTSNDSGSTIIGNSGVLSLWCIVPISGWSSNTQFAESSTYKISSYVAAGTRVTGSAPTKLGEYRSYLRNAAAATYTETNASPGDAPTVADGIRIYGGNAFSSADTNNEPSKYDIFVGKNKIVSYQWYATTGRTGFVSTAPTNSGSTAANYGLDTHYDPATGIVTILAHRPNSGSATHDCGLDAATGAVHDVWFDIIVSENALFIGAQSVRSSVRLDTHAGYGSTDTKIPYFTNTSLSGTAFTLTTNNSTSGTSITINEDGVYNFTFSINGASGARAVAAITLNETSAITTNATALANSVLLQRVWGSVVAANDSVVEACWTGYLPAGSVVRPHTDGGVPAASAASLFTACKINL